MDSPKVVVITINYNQSKMTLECLKSILESTYANFRLIVVDNGSTKEDFEFLSKNIDTNVIIKSIQQNCGYVGGVNSGLREAQKFTPNYYLVMNNDTIIDKYAIQKLVESGESYQQKAIITGKVYHFDERRKIQTTGSLFLDQRFLKESYPYKDEIDIDQFENDEERDMIDDIYWLIPDKVVKKIGYYSDNFFLYCEQGDYALRAVKNGFKLVFTPFAKLWHKGSVTTGDGNSMSPAINFWRHKGLVIYLFRNTKKIYFYMEIITMGSKLTVKNGLNFLKLRKSYNKRSELAAIVGFFYGLKWIFNKKPDNGYNPFV